MKMPIAEAAGRDRSLEVRISAGPAKLEGELNIPHGAAGLVLFAHGSGSSRHSPRNQFVARVIREAGVGTLLFDLLTASEEAEDNATAALRFDIPFLAKRLADATRWAIDQARLGHMSLGFFGSSTGAAAALTAAAEMPEHLDAVVSRGGRADMAGDALPRVKCPALLIVGERDEVVLQLNLDAMNRLQCHKELKIVPNATHLFEESGAIEAVANLAADWFSRHLGGRSPGA